MGDWYMFSHDDLLELFLSKYSNGMAVSSSWKEKGLYSWNSLSISIIRIIR